jgi:hypothetical protein
MAQSLEVIGRNSMLFIVLATLDGKDCFDLVALEDL